MRWLKSTLGIILCGVAVSAVITAMIDPLTIPSHAQKLVNWALPGNPSVGVLGLVTDALVGVIIAVPGVLVATALALYVRDHHPGETRCRRCGRLLKGLSTPRCPGCGETI
ncbi:MAG TPA: hypothetical protein VM243_06545 [Phycisphaerae bacterium]|nr:hypothetical protein [Phycisphaerae bacterium]